jgi:hypothetical protein
LRAHDEQDVNTQRLPSMTANNVAHETYEKMTLFFVQSYGSLTLTVSIRNSSQEKVMQAHAVWAGNPKQVQPVHQAKKKVCTSTKTDVTVWRSSLHHWSSHTPSDHILARHCEHLIFHAACVKAELASCTFGDLAPPDVLLIILKGCNPIGQKRYCIVFKDAFFLDFHISSLGNLAATFFNKAFSFALRAIGFLQTDSWPPIRLYVWFAHMFMYRTNLYPRDHKEALHSTS